IDRSSLPDFTPPQLAQLVDEPPTGKDWVHEIKFDGYRLQAQIADHRVRLLTRKGLDWTEKYEPIADSLKHLKAKNAVLDGEVVWLNKKGRSDFQKLQNASG